MVPEIKAEWVAALESGEYDQGRGRLAIVDLVEINGETTKVKKWCCLGVLCDLAVKAGIVDVFEEGGRLLFDDRESSVLPRVVSLWAGLDGEDNPSIKGIPLSVWNDGDSENRAHPEAHTFTEIAEAIRESDI